MKKLFFAIKNDYRYRRLKNHIREFTRDKNDKVVKYIIRRYWQENDIDYYSFQITKIKVKTNGSKLKIVFYTFRPGLMIGKGGKTIDALMETVKSLLNGYQVRWDLIENKSIFY